VQQLHDATIEELLEAVSSMRSMPRYCKPDKSRVQLVGKQVLASNGVNMAVTVLEAITRQIVKTEQTEKP
jgi:hypothetical protein